MNYLQPYLEHLDMAQIMRLAGFAFLVIGILYFGLTRGRGRAAAPAGGAAEATTGGLAFEPFEPLTETEAAPETMLDRIPLTHAGNQAIMDWAASADSFEGYDPGHAQRVAKYARALAEKFGLPPAEVDAIEAAGLLHDVGEVNQDNYIQEGRPLNAAEITQLWEHPLRGEQIVRQMPNLERAALWVRWHHEWWDGTGYPDRLKEEDIPIAARILLITDAYDAMTQDRPYRAAISASEAQAELRRKTGIMFDPQLVEEFLELLHPSTSAEGLALGV